MGHRVLKKFGRYFLMDRIAQGGMAEIFRARPATLEASGRIVIIKRILSAYGKNKDFRRMFKSEIKVMLGFSHQNIVHMHDFGEHDGQPYIAMESVDGKNLRQFMSRFKAQEKSFPVELAVYIGEQIAAGLNYAHHFKDKISGESLELVHRDVSPQNVLISYDGHVKLIDFGIAKATTNLDSTRVGIIKGKPSYLSPEQIAGDKIDGRSDLFSLGAVVWEMLTGKKLFKVEKGENEFAVLKLIEACDSYVIPPSELNPNIPKELDDIVMKSLQKRPSNRYSSAEGFQRALRKFLYSYSPDFLPSDLSVTAKDLFKDDIVEDRKLLRQLNGEVELLLANGDRDGNLGTDTGISLGAGGDDDESPTRLADAAASTGARTAYELRDLRNQDVEVDRDSLTNMERSRVTRSRLGTSTSTGTGTSTRGTHGRARESSAPSQHITKSRNLKSQFIGFAAAALIVIGVGGLFIDLDPLGAFLKGESTESLPVTVPPQISNPLPAERNPGNNEGLNNPVEEPVVESDVNPEPTPQQREAPVAQKNVPKIQLAIELKDPGATDANTEIYVNSQRVSVLNPNVQVPLDSKVEVYVNRKGYKPARRTFTLPYAKFKDQAYVREAIQLEETEYGFLTIVTTPSADATLIPIGKSREPAGAPIEFSTPQESKKLPVGRYKLRLENKVLGLEKVIPEVFVEENKNKRIEENLQFKR